MSGGLSYRDAGVDVAAGERAVELMRSAVAGTHRREVLGGIGGFAGLFTLDVARYRRPVLATSTDGVGTKVALAQALDRHDTIGLDLVAMVVDDLVVCGAEPLFLTDYLSCGRLEPDRVAAIVSGVADGCRQAGCALLGGETAEHPGLLAPDAYDLAGAAVGCVEADAVLGPDRVRAGDLLVALASSGVHANGFSLLRALVGVTDLPPAAARERWAVPAPFAPGVTLGEALLTPTRIYAADCLAVAAALPAGLRGWAHITGGGLAANLARVLPAGLQGVVDRSSWVPPSVFGWVAETGPVADAELEQALNMGVGMVGICARNDAAAAVSMLAERQLPAWVCGEVRAAPAQTAPRVTLVGRHPGWRPPAG